MTIRYMLDTNIVSDIVRNPFGIVVAKIAQVDESAVALSIITAAELRYGVARRGSQRLIRAVNRVLDEMTVLPFDVPSDISYAEIRTGLEKSGQLIGANDLMIAAHALAIGAVLVTANIREFARVPDLKIENWLA